MDEIRDPRNVSYQGASDEVGGPAASAGESGPSSKGKKGGKGGGKGKGRGGGKGRASATEVVAPRKKDAKVIMLVDDATAAAAAAAAEVPPPATAPTQDGEASAAADSATPESSTPRPPLLPLEVHPTFGNKRFVFRLADDREGRIKRYYPRQTAEPSKEYLVMKRGLKAVHHQTYERLVRQAYHAFKTGVGAAGANGGSAPAAERVPVVRAVLGTCAFSNRTQDWLVRGARVEAGKVAAACNNVEVDTEWRAELNGDVGTKLDLTGFTKLEGTGATAPIHQLKGYRLQSGARVDLEVQAAPGAVDGELTPVRLISACDTHTTKITDCIRAGHGPLKPAAAEEAEVDDTDTPATADVEGEGVPAGPVETEAAKDNTAAAAAATDDDTRSRVTRFDMRLRTGFAKDWSTNEEIVKLVSSIYTRGDEVLLPITAAMGTACYRKKALQAAAASEAADGDAAPKAKDAVLGTYTKGMLTLTLSRVTQHDDPDRRPTSFYYGELAAPEVAALLAAGAARPAGEEFDLRGYAKAIYRFIAECYALLGWGVRDVDAAEEEALYASSIEGLVKQVEKLESGPVAWLSGKPAAAAQPDPAADEAEKTELTSSTVA